MTRFPSDTVEPAMSRRSTAPLEAVILPDLPPPRRNRWGIVLVSAAFLACLAVIVAVIWGIGTLATTGRRAPTDNQSLAEHWEEPAERLANIKRAMTSAEVGASAGELRDFHRLLARVASAARASDREAHLSCIDLNLLVHRISQHPQVRGNRDFSSWSIKSELEVGLAPFSQVGEFSIVRVERGNREDQVLLYTVDWDYSITTACRWWLVRHGRNWRLFDWERLDYEQSLAHTWAIRDSIHRDPLSYNYTVLRGAVDAASSLPGGRYAGPRRAGGTDLASLIDDPLPAVIHDAAMIDLAWALVGQSRPGDAIRAANSLARPQDHPGYLIVRARAHNEMNRHSEALADARQYEQAAGPDPLALEQAAMALAHLGRHREAADCWRSMLRLAPNHREALTNFCRLSDPDQRGELAEILRATRQPTETAASQAQAAILQDDLALFKQLADFLEKAAPGSPAAIAAGAQRLACQGQHDRAAAEFQRAAAAEFRPDKKEQYFHQFLEAMTDAGKIAEGYAAASDPQAAFDYLTSGWEEHESDLTNAQLKELLAAHARRVPGDGHADFLAGQLHMREGDYALAEAKFEAAIDKAADDEQEYYRSEQIEALYRLGRSREAYQRHGQTPSAFRSLARLMESDGQWDELRDLIAQHRRVHDDDRWADYYAALDYRERGERAMALQAISQAEQDEQLKSICTWLKRTLLIEASLTGQLFASAENPQEEFLNLARILMYRQNWEALDELLRNRPPQLEGDVEVVELWSDVLFRQGRIEEALQALHGWSELAASSPLHVRRELAEREVRCLLRLDRVPEARHAAERAAAELGMHRPLVMVLLAGGDFASLRQQLEDPAVQSAISAQSIDSDRELVPLLVRPELADLRARLTVPVTSMDADAAERLILLVREPPQLTSKQLAERLAELGLGDARIVPVSAASRDQHASTRSSFAVQNKDHLLLVSVGAVPYWKPSGISPAPRDAALRAILEQHGGYIVVESLSGESDPHAQAARLVRQLAAEFQDVLAVYGRRPGSHEWRLVPFDDALLAELKSGAFLSQQQKAGGKLDLSDRERYPNDGPLSTASHAGEARRRAAIELARQMHSGSAPPTQVRIAMWRGHACEALWLDVVAARRDPYGDWQLVGELTADCALRPALLKGTRLLIEPYEVEGLRAAMPQ
jgi:hypothetical protein